MYRSIVPGSVIDMLELLPHRILYLEPVLQGLITSAYLLQLTFTELLQGSGSRPVMHHEEHEIFRLPPVELKEPGGGFRLLRAEMGTASQYVGDIGHLAAHDFG
jgi:hypothetical protein